MKTKRKSNTEISKDGRGPERGAFLDIRSKMALSFCVLTAAAVVLTALAITFGTPLTSDPGYYGVQKSNVMRMLSLAADLKKERLLVWLDERKRDAEVLSRSKTLQSFLERAGKLVGGRSDFEHAREQLRAMLIDDASYQAAKERLLGDVGAQRSLESIQVADAGTGLVLVCTNEADLGTCVSAEPSFTGALRAGSRTWIGMQSSRSGGEATLVISRPISGRSAERDPESKPIAVLIVRIDPEQSIRPILYSGPGLGKTGDIVLVNQDFEVLISPKYPLKDGAQAKPLHYKIEAGPAKLAAGGHDGIVAGHDYRDVSVLAAYRHIRISPESGWGMVVKVDQSEVFGPLKRKLFDALFIGVFVVISAILCAVVISRRLSRPILELSRTAQEVKRGNLGIRSSVVSSDEVGFLAGTFNEMIERIENWHTELEEQVEARTSELSDLNEELEAKNAELERFTYTVSHDLSSPLITIKTFAGFIKEGLEEGKVDNVQSDLDRIVSAADRMGRLLEELLELSRIGRIHNPSSEVPMTELALEAAAMLGGLIVERGVEVEIAEHMPAVVGDRPRLLEVVQNLLHNALKFMGDQPTPKVEMGMRNDPHEWVFYVRDNGVGIDAAYQERIFRLFDKLDKDSEGTGIGLAIVKRIVEVHKGRIWVESEGRGHGACFCFTIPGVDLTAGDQREDQNGR